MNWKRGASREPKMVKTTGRLKNENYRSSSPHSQPLRNRAHLPSSVERHVPQKSRVLMCNMKFWTHGTCGNGQSTVDILVAARCSWNARRQRKHMSKAYMAPEMLHTKNTHQLPCPQESHCTKKPRLRPPMSQNIPKHGLQPASFMHACKKILECYLTLPLPWLLLNSALLVPEENTPWAAFLGSGEPQGYQVVTPLVWHQYWYWGTTRFASQ